MWYRIFTAFIMVLFFAPISSAQDDGRAWVQIQSMNSQAVALQRLQAYSQRIEDVNGFLAGGGWFAVALGPYSPEDARRVLQVYRAEGLIPRDSFVTGTGTYRQQFWPQGENYLANPALEIPQVLNLETAQNEPEPVPEPDTETTEAEDVEEPLIQPSDETRQQARASERALSRQERAQLQIMLRWAGAYQGRIDAAFGPGTRLSMRRWQEQNNYEQTGILTTAQRAELLRQYNAVLVELGVEQTSDETAGVSIKMPTALVVFDKYEPPFAHYSAKNDELHKVLLISQEGNRDTFAGLYDIMQSLAIVPEEGQRQLQRDQFTLIGEGTRFISHTEARFDQGVIKGFTLVWPVGDEERRTRLLAEMQESYAVLDGVLPHDAGSDEEQIDLVAGLEVRKPLYSHSGFFVDSRGAVLTTASVIDGCSKITIDDDYEASVAAHDADLGIAVLRPNTTLSPMAVAQFQGTTPRLNSEIASSGFSYGGVLGAPTMTFGSLADLKGLQGETHLKRLDLSALEGDAGGPVLDTRGAVLGMLMPAPKTGRTLPDGVSFSTKGDTLKNILEAAQINPQTAGDLESLGAEELTDGAAKITVLVSCWE